MTKQAYADALAQARKDLEELTVEKFRIDAKIARLKSTIEIITALSDEQGDADVILKVLQGDFDESLGITDAIRGVMQRSSLPMTAPQIRDALEAHGYDISQYSSILTVIHNTIKRMDKQGEISAVHNSLGVFVGWIYKAQCEPPAPINLQ